MSLLSIFYPLAYIVALKQYCITADRCLVNLPRHYCDIWRVRKDNASYLQVSSISHEANLSIDKLMVRNLKVLLNEFMIGELTEMINLIVQRIANKT